MNKPKLFVMVGLSASGKSTIASQLSESEDAIIVSSDSIREELGDINDQSKNKEVFKIFHKRISDNLRANHNVIADATNLTIKSRKLLISNVRHLDIEIIAVIVVKSYEDCIIDNLRRDRKVPIEVLERQRKNFQIPFYGEGFDDIILRYPHGDYLDCDVSMFYNKFIKPTIGYDQKNPHHTDTLDKHMKKVEYGLVGCNNYTLVHSARLHDVGKPFVQSFDDDGIAHYYNHANVGAYELMVSINSYAPMMVKKKTTKLLFLAYVNYHMMPYDWKGEKTRLKYRKLFGDELYYGLVALHEADKIR